MWLNELRPGDAVLVCEGDIPRAQTTVGLASDNLIFLGDGKGGTTFDRGTGVCLSGGPRSLSLRDPNILRTMGA